MKFASIEYTENKKRMVLDKLNSIFKPFEYESISLMGADGYKIKVNISYESGIKEKNIVLSKVERFLSDSNVGAVTGEKFENFYNSNGRIIIAGIIRNHIGERDEVVVIDGDYNLTENVLCMVCPKVNYISLLTDDNEKHRNLAEYFMSEYGLNLVFINDFRHENFKSANVIINLGQKSENYDYVLKKNCVYYDVYNDEKRINRMKRTRSDINIVNEIKLCPKGLTAAYVESILFVANVQLRRLIIESLDISEKMQLIDDMDLSTLTSQLR